MKQIFLVGFIVFATFAVVYTVFASSKDDIVFPVAELGNCAEEQECRAYCDDLDHARECLAFAEQHNLLPRAELEEAKKFLRLGVQSGPGGCRGKAQCETYCEDVSHIEECLGFAEQHGIMEPEELEEARKVARALRQGAQLPGGCRGKAECEAYCEEPSHIEECLNFAEAAGFLESEELEEARRVAPLMARGEMPGGCRSRQQCEAYCSDEAHTEECVTFFQKAGFMTPEEAEMFRKTGGKGPGDCRGRDECENFCNDPANQAVCFEFAKEHDLIPEEELANLQEGIGRFREGLENAPPEVAQCLKDVVGEDVLSKIEAGTFLPNPEMGEHMKRCFEEFFPRSFEGEQGEGFGPGPGREGEFAPPPEAQDCIRRILGDLSGPPGPDQEQRIREECFPERPDHPESFEEFPEGFEGEHREIPEEFRDRVPEEFQGEFEARQQEEFDRQFQEGFQRQFDQQFQEEFQRQFEQQAPEGFVPPEDFTVPEEFSPPPPPPSDAGETHEEPQARVPREGFLGAVLDAMAPALKRLLPFLPL